MRTAPLRFLLVVALVAAAAAPAPAEEDRRDRQYPELVLETGGRTGTCDALHFTPDGRRLYAVGDDKVVHSWKVGPASLELANVLRWSSWREQRGAIYTVALSPDGTRVAVGGFGMRTGTVAVFDWPTGELKAALQEPKENQVVRAITFTPDGSAVVFGTENGKVWRWRPGEKTPQWLASHRSIGREFNRVRLLAWPEGNRLLSAAESGEVLELDPTGQGEARPWLDLKPNPGVRFYRMALSPDRKWLAAAATNSNFVAVRALDGAASKRDINLARGEHPRSIAFNPTDGRLAVGVGRAHSERTNFYIAGDDRVAVYVLDAGPRSVAEFQPGYHAEALAFHPDGKRLAVAGGSNHDVTLWDTTRPTEPLARAVGVGRCLWEIGLSKDDRYLGWREQRDGNPAGPNQRGAGPWGVFDLKGIERAPGEKFTPAQTENTTGWRVTPDAKDMNVWHVVAPNGRQHTLPLDPGRDQMPQCYAFLPGKPPRLIVGHYWGLSVFELSPTGVRRSRLYTGHQGLVTAVAVSANGKWLVSASRDQTIAGWSLADWDYHPELGASFAVRDGALFVTAIDTGSPAWEAGLVVDDEVLTLVTGGGNMVYNRERFEDRGKEFARTGNPPAAHTALKQFEPGKELYFRLRRDGKVIDALTTVRQRPLWRFFPAIDNEWVLWMWREPYYLTSTNGDSLVGWLVNDPDLDRAPTLRKLAQFRAYYNQESVLGILLTTRDVREALKGQKSLPFNTIEPPVVSLETDSAELGAADPVLTLTVKPRSTNPDQVPVRVELWLNDYRLEKWDAGGAAFRKKYTVRRELFRAGRNELTLQVFTRKAHEGKSVSIIGPRAPKTQKLHTVFVGVNDYRRARLKDGKPPPDLRFSVQDAHDLHERWQDEAGDKKLFAPGQARLLVEELPGKKRIVPLRKEEIVAALRAVAKVSGPDDRVIIFLSGHGDLQGPEEDYRSFVFCPPNFSQQDSKTGLSSQELADEFARINGRKVVLLDTCHSFGILNPIRALTPGGRGPIIFASCDRDQGSYENEVLGHGLFTQALLEALQGKDQNKPGQPITPREIRDWLRTRVPDLARRLKQDVVQTPIGFLSGLEDLPLARRPPEPAPLPAGRSNNP